VRPACLRRERRQRWYINCLRRARTAWTGPGGPYSSALRR
jgi:hypothetical protein